MREGPASQGSSVGWLPRLSACLRVAPPDEEATIMTPKHARRPVEATRETSDASGRAHNTNIQSLCTVARATDATTAW